MSLIKRLLTVGSLSLLLSCGLTGGANNATHDGGFPSAHAAPAPVTAIDASAVATDGLTAAHVQALFPSALGTFKPDSAKSPHLPTIDENSPNTTALGLAVGVAAFGEGRHISPLGGVMNVTAGRTALHATFVGYRTLHGRLNGDVDVRLSSGNVVAGTYRASVRFRRLLLDTPGGTQRFDGTAVIDVASSGTQSTVTFTSNATYSFRGSTIRYNNLVAKTAIAIEGAAMSGTQSLDGAVTVDKMNGLNGAIAVHTAKPLAFTAALNRFGGAAATFKSGQILFGDDLTLDVVRPNIVTLTVKGQKPKLYAWGYLGGTSRAGYAVRRAVAQTLFQGGNVLTINDKAPTATALALMDGRVLAVGSTNDVFPFQGPLTKVVNITGKTVMPGFVEPHAHTSLSALNLLANVDPRVVPCGTEALGNTIENVLARLKAAVAKAPDAKAFYGFGFDPSRLVKNELMQNLTLQQLDAVSPTVPIVVQNASQHVSYVNSAAFRATGVWPTAPNGPFSLPADSPLNGFVPTDPKTGLPTGIINDFGQTPFLKLAVGVLTETKADKIAFAKQWREFQNVLAKAGVTTYADMLLGAFAGPDMESELLQGLSLDPTNPCRIRAYVNTAGVDPKTLDMFPGEGDDRVRIIGAKFVSDGSTQGLTAGLSFNYAYPGPYPAKPNGLTEFKSADDFYNTALPWYQAGWQLAIHANGDRAVDYVLGGLAMLAKKKPNKDARFRIEHFTVHTPAEVKAQVALAKRLNVVVGFTIGHVYFWGQVFHDTLLGDANSEYLVPLKTLIDGGLIVATHSDSPVTSPNPLRNVYIATNRLWQAQPQKVLNPSEIITVPQALKTITINPAYSLSLEGKVGSLEVGKLADLVVLSADPTKVKPSDIGGIRVLGTWLEGRQVSGAKQ